MSQRHSTGSLGDKALLLDHRPISNNGVSPHEKCTSTPSLESAGLQAEGSTSFSKPRRIVLSTESPAALKVGTHQLIPRSLAEDPKAKVPIRHQSFSDVGTGSREVVHCDPKRLSAPSISLDELEDELDMGEGTLKRNLRNMSYRAAMKGVRNGGEPELPKSTGGLKPVLEEAKPPHSRSPGRSKRTLGRKRLQHHGGSFKDDPRLYQEIREKGLNSINHESDDDLLEADVIPEEHPSTNTVIMVKSYRPAQATWSQQPEVLETGILEWISPEERKRQEAIFEIITSEYSYIHSMAVLVEHFLKSEGLRETMTQTDHHHLFSNIGDILAVSKSFFEDLEKRHQEHVVISDISDIVEAHASRHFNPYVIYCSNEVYQQRTLQKLLATNTTFKETLKHIERKPECGGLPLISFLILPMQRVTRLPLLMDTVCQKTQMNTATYQAATQALKAISKLVKKCNEGAHTMERTEQMCSLQNQLDFGKVKNFPLISASRWLLKRGEVALPLAEEGGIFRKGSGRGSCYLFVFNDVLIITKKKSEESYTVLNYAMLDHLSVEKIESLELSTGLVRGGHLFRLTLQKDSEGKQEMVILATESRSDRARWISALMHREEKETSTAEKGALKQVEITRAYLAKQADEISLQQTDVVLVLNREEGWYLGERLRDGEKGWFPQACAQEITNRNAVQRNVQRMERLRIETDV
ncbi:rho guanine nucleotide exchange factor 16 [Python bivittatus]|uniref:Rho guanine nucleotide exchange factor 16 n=1 Tax=Python bivittatus TaxID=176946 RepID=A0A9F2QXX9_PYTBI|nr:rho guanine nucleotide exchange factor 16 [Python bivittatus]XP_015743909.1 rho guanine nucleotide exchange factor 16 [Python bivittatus]XP_025023684.1 rho guanine nucleotide exchange factor 16 [Python bivittatus]XP_025023685.1 rho guanine nucleotide exchange factor 16 [Python bivittatus]